MFCRCQRNCICASAFTLPYLLCAIYAMMMIMLRIRLREGPTHWQDYNTVAMCDFVLHICVYYVRLLSLFYVYANNLIILEYPFGLACLLL